MVCLYFQTCLFDLGDTNWQQANMGIGLSIYPRPTILKDCIKDTFANVTYHNPGMIKIDVLHITVR